MGLTKTPTRGARQHNLKNISLEIPRNTFTVITGLSGSGKSSLAFDTIYAEGQRRYVESLSPSSRVFPDPDTPPRRPFSGVPLPRHCHRAENHLAFAPLHRRYCHRN